MKHSLHIALSPNLKEIFIKLTKNISKKGNGFEGYLAPYLYVGSEGESSAIEEISLAPHSIYDFIPLDKDNISVNFIPQQLDSQPVKADVEDISGWLNDQYNKRVIIQREIENALNVCLYICSWEKDSIKKVKLWVESVIATNRNITIDIIVLNQDLSQIVSSVSIKKSSEKNQAYEAVKTLIGSVSDHVRNIILVQNRQKDGFSLNFTSNSLAHFLSEFTLLYVEDDRLFVSSASTESRLRGMGLAIFDFDKYYFAEYLLSSAYLHIMTKEGITDNDADVNALQSRISGVLKKRYGDKVGLLSDFWKKVVIKQQSDGKTDEQIVVTAAEEAKKYISSLAEDLQEFIKADDLSFPEKRAGLAILLSEDDEIFVGEQYNSELLDIDDCISEAAELFVSYHNDIVDSGCNEYAALNVNDLADKEGHVYFPLKELKALKQEMKETSQNARRLQSIVEQEEKNIQAEADSTKVLIGDNHTIKIGDEVIKIEPLQHEEKSFDQVYVPREGKLESSVDLRSMMPEIRSQGNVGACTAYSTVSVFEYLLSNKEQTRLSELYVYYMSRTYTDRTHIDEGVSIHDSIQSLMDYGVCPWELWDNTQSFDSEPSEEAKKTARDRVVTVAMNVEHNIEHFKSAISEGYPVIFGLKLYNSFANPPRGFVTWPEEGEQELGNHAMVMCGYSDEGKFFIVRNSWGTTYGDDGYCYIPYSYIADPAMLHASFIIKEINVGEHFARVVNSKPCVNFDYADAFFRYAIARNLFAEEERKLALLAQHYANLSQYYQNILLLLTKSDVRRKLTMGKQQILETALDKAKAERESMMQRHLDEKISFDKKTMRICGWFGIALVVFIVLAFVSWKYAEPNGITEVLYQVRNVCWWLSGLTALSAVICYFVRKSARKRLNEDQHDEETAINMQIANYSKEIEMIKLKAHIAGLLHVEMYNLKTSLLKKHKILKSFSANLLQWYGEEKERISTLSVGNDVPYISVLDDSSLHKFFEDNKDKLTQDIHLYQLIENFELSEEGIKQFKKDLKETVLARIFDFCSGFKMSEYVLQNTEVPFLKACKPPKEFLIDLQNRSKVFVFFKPGQLPNDINTKMVLGSCKLEDEPVWNTTKSEVFSQRVVDVEHVSENQIVMMQWSEIDSVDELDLQ